MELSGFLTFLYIGRRKLVTKEKSKKAYEGKLQNEDAWKDRKISLNDDLEVFLESQVDQQEIEADRVCSFLLQKLTNNELKLVADKNEHHSKSYFHYHINGNFDVDAKEMKISNSKSKYVDSFCSRWTLKLDADLCL